MGGPLCVKSCARLGGGICQTFFVHQNGSEQGNISVNKSNLKTIHVILHMPTPILQMRPRGPGVTVKRN